MESLKNLSRIGEKMSAKLLEMPKMKCADRGEKLKHPKIEKTLAE